MKFKNPTILFSYLKQLLLMVGLVYAFSNCQVKKSMLHFAGIEFELSQKSLTQLPLQGSCSVLLHHKNIISKKSFSSPETPIIPGLQIPHFQQNNNLVFNSLQIHPAFEFDKSSTSYPPIFIVFQNLKIAPLVVS